MQKNMGWWSVHSVTAMDIFKIQNAYVAQSAGALGSLKRKQNNLHSSWKLDSVGGGNLPGRIRASSGDGKEG